MPKQIGLFDSFQDWQESIAGGGLRSSFTHTYNDIISVENLLAAWTEFRQGKRTRADVIEFQINLMTNILQLHDDLHNHTYTHGGYEHFIVTDPKCRDIHKASVRDRLVHHAIYRILYLHFDTRFIGDSYSCRNNKGTHKAIKKFQKYSRKVSNNHTKTCYVLKCDIRKFFASIDHGVLLKILEKQIPDKNIIALLQEVIASFHSTELGKGLPLGNFTSQLLVNIYMNEFDQYIKHTLKIKHYIRYADDFVCLHHDKNELLATLSYIIMWLQTELHLRLHPNKISIETVASGVDFLGWVQFPHHMVLRGVTRRRVMKRFRDLDVSEASIQSYLGLFRHGDSYGLLRASQRQQSNYFNETYKNLGRRMP